MADEDSSDLSSLSSLSPVPSDIESEAEPEATTKGDIRKFFPKLAKGKKATVATKEPSPPPRKRSPSPPHENAFIDNPDIAFLVMFRSRFNEAFPKSLANFGPQELEQDIIGNPPGERVEAFLCALLFLLLNRKQDVKYVDATADIRSFRVANWRDRTGQYSKAVDDALSAHKSQWPRSWEGANPLSGSNTFHSITPTQRLSLLRALALWSLSASEIVKAIINKSYKGNRHDDDLNQPLSVQPWGSDSDKRRYFLIEGLDDTAFRVYRESNPAGFNRTWWSVAGSIDELKVLSEKLESKDGGPKARKLAEKMTAAIPRFEGTEEKRRRREYRQAQKARFKRPEPGFSVYEGRTRGKRIKYTYSDDEDFLTDSSNRRSARNTGTSTPAEPAGPVTTASGRQIRAPPRMNGSSAANSVNGDSEDSRQQSEPTAGPGGRPRRAAAVNHGTNGWSSKGTRTRGRDSMDDDDDDVSEPDLGDDEEDHVPDESEEDDDELDEDVEMADDDLLDEPRKSLIVKLSVKKSPTTTKTAMITPAPEDEKPSLRDDEMVDEIVAKPRENTLEPVINVATTKQPLSPAAVQTSLAFRGSPDKLQSMLQQVDVGARE
ncbi:hypothetical protein CORC01_08625 [Colletotrichum orchidophilum]|uniref:WHIM1 domain-containing protein n=1 Tax=Colletotrichum orchidophilum TaxID=1209926 RepID=A0A1G4B3T8_9PEZI|nr:uncharacterized protein CORC01_08625 [Colletotrichum orchidophilum]OHE96088.1 hypothetical protein CORC01_08625 [Colletotrichum orchidophilum]